LKATLVPVDSEVLQGNVLAVEDFDASADFSAFEAEYLGRYRPVYVSCKIPLDRVGEVHSLEEHGFRLIECQIRSAIILRATTNIPAVPYAFEKVTTDAELDAVLQAVGTAFENDRFSVDPLLPGDVSGARYRSYVERSFRSPDEAVYRLYDPKEGTTVAFKTHRYVGNAEALLLLGGVSREYRRLGLGVVNTYAELNELRRLGITRAVTHFSAANYQIFNLEIGRLGYRVLKTFAVLRKIYPRSLAT